ncbi:reverse transcriptase domain-containing protein, partial [Bacillus sp. SRB_8]|uniref:reverse transcriptase domain-containing protein n=1 Tax=Bacillus sp. SRB_8 TaxID=1969377 RepID=UPI000DC5ECEC
VVYLDDILIYSNNALQHDVNVRLVLTKLRSAGLFAKLEKCVFDAQEVEFFGYLVIESRLKMDPSKVETILDWATPATAKDFQSFLGFANFYREFIVDFAKISSPLTALTRKNHPFTWSSAAESAFVTLTRAFTPAPVMKHFDPNLPIILETDAFD